MNAFHKILDFVESKVPVIPLVLYYSLKNTLFSTCPNEDGSLFVSLYIFYCLMTSLWSGFRSAWKTSQNILKKN